jgi:hypothetical protein
MEPHTVQNHLVTRLVSIPRVTCAARPLPTAEAVHARTWHIHDRNVFILEHCFASKPFAALREAFGSGYPDKQAPNGDNILGHWKFSSATNPHRTTKQLKLRPCCFQLVHQLEQRLMAAGIQHCLQFRRVVHKSFLV